MTTRIAWLDGKTLDGGDNAFGIIAAVSRYLKELGNDRAVIATFQKEAMNNDNAGMLQYITDTTGITFTEQGEEEDY